MQQTIGPDEAILALNQFDDELAVWVIRRAGTSVTVRALRRADARLIVARQQDEISLQASPGAGTVLYDNIVRPVSSQLAGVTRLSFVPDATYQDVSFAALWDRSKSRFLVEQMTLAAAPSVAMRSVVV